MSFISFSRLLHTKSKSWSLICSYFGKPQMITSMSPTQLLPTENQIAKKVSLALTNGHLQQVISLLVAQQIPFEISFTNKENTTPAPLPPSEPSRALYKDSFHNSIIDKIYHKYITSGFESPIPTETVIANEFGLSIEIFRRKFKNMYGSTFLQLYMAKRMERAQELLCQGLTCQEVARQVGYGLNSGIKFNKMFQKYVGMTPKKYQIKYQK